MAKDNRKTTRAPQRRAGNSDGDTMTVREKSVPNYLKPTMSSCGGSNLCQYPTSQHSACVRKSVIAAKTTLPSPSPRPNKERSSPLPKLSKPAVSYKATKPSPQIKNVPNLSNLVRKNRTLSKGIKRIQPSSPKKKAMVKEEKHEDKIGYEEEGGPMTPRAKATSFSEEDEVTPMMMRRNSVRELVGAFETVIVSSESQLPTTQKGEESNKFIIVKDETKDVEESEIGQNQHENFQEIKVEVQQSEEIKTEANELTKESNEEDEGIEGDDSIGTNKEEEDKSNNEENKLTLSTEVEITSDVLPNES